jgi:flagellar assembly protein FliH
MGRREGQSTARAELEAEMNLSLARERQRIVDAANQFRTAKDRYFADVEQEVVNLALAIAARVLHREAQVDPLLLTGVVRVALEKMADRSGVVLRVAGADVEAWEKIFDATEESERPRVAEDPRFERGECVLETKMGTVELGVRVQLEEIEKGFFDLLHHRPVE